MTMNALSSELRATSPWRIPLASLLALLALTLLLYARTLGGMVEIWWRSETFAHAFLVLPISLWLIWRQRAAIAQIRPRPNPWALVAMAAVAVFWLLSDLVAVNAGSQFAIVALLILAVPCLLGTAVTRAILFPLLFLFFMVPFGEFLLPVLMKYTADFTVAALRLSGIPVYREGQQFVIPSGTWSVVQACSGIRYLIASVMVGALFAYLNFQRWQRRAAFIAVATLVPVVANWLRAYGIVMLGHLSGNRLAVGVDHLIYGWLFFGIVITIMFLIGARWSEPEPEHAHTAPAAAVASTAGAPARALLLCWIGAAALLALGPAVEQQVQAGERLAGPPRITLPGQLTPGWNAVAKPAIASWSPHYIEPSVLAARVYGSADGEVGLTIAYYRNQTPERKLVSSENMLIVPGDHQWNQIETQRLAWNAATGVTSVESAQLIASMAVSGERPAPLTVWRLNWADGRFVVGDVRIKLVGALGRLRGHGDDGAAVMIYAQGDAKTAGERIARFAGANLDTIEALLERTRAQR